jgi:hypothetical protein
MKSGRSLVELARELERQLGTKKDLLVPLPRTHHRTAEDGECALEVEEATGVQRYGITPLARRQLAEKLKIPHAYFERMRTEQPELLDRNVNAWLDKEENERHLLRTLDGKVRAVLSERYRRLDNYDLLEHVLPTLQQLPEARLESAELTETRLYLKVVTPRISFEVAPGDVVQAGVVVSNSEVGCGMLSVQPLAFRLVCSNGLIASDRMLRKTHVGRPLDSEQPTGVVFKDDTLQADDRAFFLRVRDVVEMAVSESTLRLVGEKLRRTREMALTGDPVQAVEVLAQRHGLTETERAGVLRSLIEGGDLSGFGLVNAVTHFSQQVADYDRATELESLGGRLVESPASDWKSLGVEA